MGPKISTETGQSTKLGLDHRHLKSGLVKCFHYAILIFLYFIFILNMFNIKFEQEKVPLF